MACPFGSDHNLSPIRYPEGSERNPEPKTIASEPGRPLRHHRRTNVINEE